MVCPDLLPYPEKTYRHSRHHLPRSRPGAESKYDPGFQPDEALQKAYDLVGKDASVVVIPDGVAVLAVKEGQA